MTPRLLIFEELKQHFPVQICVCTSVTIFFSLSPLFFLLLSDSVKQSRSPLDSRRRSTPENTPYWVSEPNMLTLCIYILCYYWYIYYTYSFLSVTHIAQELSIPPRTQYRYSCRLMITHNGHSRSISLRFSCNFLDTLHSFTITVSSRLCHLQFCRNHQFSSPDNKHGQDSATSPTS